MLITAALAVACGPSHEPDREVVVWQSGQVEPRFEVPPEAAWQPRYQRLFQDHQDEVGGDVIWACYSTDDSEQALAFYADLHAEPAEWRPEHPETWQALAERIAAAEGLAVPATPPEPRWTGWDQHDDLPAVTLHTPYVDAESGAIAAGALLVLRWQEGGQR